MKFDPRLIVVVYALVLVAFSIPIVIINSSPQFEIIQNWEKFWSVL